MKSVAFTIDFLFPFEDLYEKAIWNGAIAPVFSRGTFGDSK
jgi:hypothetical protein